MLEWLGLGLLFLTVFGIAMSLMLWVQGRSAPPVYMDESGQLLDSHPDFFIENFAEALADQVPISTEGETELSKELRESGHYSRHAMLVYRAIRTLGMFVPILIALLMTLVVPRPQMPVVLLCGLVGAVLGFSVPRLVINAQARARKAEIERGLPVVIDLLALGLSAGQSLDNALGRVVREISEAFPVLSSELAIVQRQAQLNSLPPAMEQFAWRVQVPEVQSLATIISQASKLGTDVYAALLEFSSHMRTNLRQRADTQANRASLMMLFPTIFGLWIPTAMILVAPIFFDFQNRREKATEIMKQRQEEQQEILEKAKAK